MVMVKWRLKREKSGKREGDPDDDDEEEQKAS